MKYQIQIELENIEGGKSALARHLKKVPATIGCMLKNGNARFTTQEKYTKAFNKVFKTNYTREYLFEKIEQGEQAISK